MVSPNPYQELKRALQLRNAPGIVFGFLSILIITPCLGFVFREIPLTPKAFAIGGRRGRGGTTKQQRGREKQGGEVSLQVSDAHDLYRWWAPGGG